MIERLMELLEFRIDTLELDLATAEYDRQISSMIDNDDEAKAYIAQLEASRDLEQTEDDVIDPNFEQQVESGSIESLTEEVQNFLRNHKKD